MDRYLSEIEEFTDFGELFAYVSRACIKKGVVRHSYHLTPMFSAQTSEATTVYTNGFSDEWVRLYNKADFRSIDPIPERVMNFGTIMTWKDAMRAGENSPQNLEYFAAMREHGLIHGIGTPLFGPRGRDAYASFDFDLPVEVVGPERIGEVRSLAQAAHQRVCVLLDRLREKPELSDREREVLSWIAKGKSNESIAAILDLSPDTVKTYVKRVFAKLDSTDRISATIKALKLGLIKT